MMLFSRNGLFATSKYLVKTLKSYTEFQITVYIYLVRLSFNFVVRQLR